MFSQQQKYILVMTRCKIINIFLDFHKKLTDNMTNILCYAIINIIKIGVRNNRNDINV